MELFVAPNGADTNPGTKGRPLASMEAARDRLRAIGTGPRTIVLRPGTYMRARTFALDARDSDLTLRAEPGARLLGGRIVQGWKPSNDPRLPAAARGRVVQLPLKISDPGGLRRRGFGVETSPAPLEVFVDNVPQTLARWPNGDSWATIAEGAEGGFTAAADPKRLARWAKADDLWVHGYWTFDWADTVEKVTAVDPGTRRITTAPPHGAYGYKTGKRFYALNLIEELDAPGEYWLDRKTDALFFYPPHGGETVVSTLSTPLISVRDAKRVTIEGLTLACSRDRGIAIVGGEGVRIVGCTLRGLGTDGIAIDGGARHQVIGCDLFDLGESGILMTGGDRKTLTPAGHMVENCEIHHHSRLCFTYRPAIGIHGVGNRARHNRLHDGPHNAILMSGNDHEVAFNEIFRVCTQTGDAGAVYMGRDLTMRGIVIRHNWFHDIGPTLTATDGFVDVMAVYLDDCFSGTTVVGNIFERAGRAAMIGGGRDNTIENNLFIGCDPAIHVDSRGKGWASKYFVPNGEWRIFETLADVHPKDPPYATHYPALATIYDDPDIPFARGNRLLRNVIVGTGRPIEWQDGLSEKTVETDGNVIVKTPAEVGLNPKVFTVTVKGFAPIPFSQIGLQKGRGRHR
jgi:hypothetical protein